jgi:hypothetical protein
MEEKQKLVDALDKEIKEYEASNRQLNERELQEMRDKYIMRRRLRRTIANHARSTLIVRPHLVLDVTDPRILVHEHIKNDINLVESLLHSDQQQVRDILNVIRKKLEESPIFIDGQVTFVEHHHSPSVLLLPSPRGTQ